MVPADCEPKDLNLRKNGANAAPWQGLLLCAIVAAERLWLAVRTSLSTEHLGCGQQTTTFVQLAT